MPIMHPDRLFPVEHPARNIARNIYQHIRDLPIVGPHGHVEPAWLANNNPFPNPAGLLIIPDHYLLRMLYSQGISPQSMGLKPRDGSSYETDPRVVWKRFAEHFHLFLGTPSHMWLSHSLADVFKIEEPLNGQTANQIYDQIEARLATEAFLPRNLFETFNIETLATTDFAVDNLQHHQRIKDSGWKGHIVPTFRPDDVTNPEHPLFQKNIYKLGKITRLDICDWDSYLDAIRQRRTYFKALGATATDHGFPTAFTTVLPKEKCQQLLTKALEGSISEEESELFRGHILIELARMSCDDKLVMQLHVGSCRNHNQYIFERFGSDAGCDIPTSTNFVDGLHRLLNEVGNHPDFSLVIFTLDESSYSRELAPLAGHYPVLKIGPAWWFYDSPEGMLRYYQQIIETAGFHNTAGFNDDTRAFLSIPARHDMSRRVQCHFLAKNVAEHRFGMDEAIEIAHLLAYQLPKNTYRF